MVMAEQVHSCKGCALTMDNAESLLGNPGQSGVDL